MKTATSDLPPRCRTGCSLLWGVGCLAVSCYAASELAGAGNFLRIGVMRILLNLLCTGGVWGIFGGITGKGRLSVALSTLVLMLLATGNALVYQFRGTELIPADLHSAGMAFRVVGQYHPECGTILFWWMIWGVAIGSQRLIPRTHAPSPAKCRLTALAVVLACVLTLPLGTSSLQGKSWGNEGSTCNGFFLNFYLGLRDRRAEQPEGYSAHIISALEAQYPLTERSVAGALPDIVVIMSESFADLRLLGELSTNEPVTPFLDSLEENTVQGFALTSSYGGNTANAEFEFLTGHSMAFLPGGTVAYQQYLHNETASLPRILSRVGYETGATHPYDAGGWSRNRVYPLLGFQESTFLQDYPQQNLLRGFVRDQEMVEYILARLESQGEQPLFLFGVSMQNHGGYTYHGADAPNCIHLTDGNFPAAEQYLSLLRQTDDAMKDLLTQLSSSERDTIVLFFGDHWPALEEGFYQALHGGGFDSLQEQMLCCTVPFFLWANFDIAEETAVQTSLNYLGVRLLQAAGVQLPPYYQFLEEMQAQIPAINAFGCVSPESGGFIPLDAAVDRESLWLNRYAILQYNALFDKKNRSGQFFPD